MSDGTPFLRATLNGLGGFHMGNPGLEPRRGTPVPMTAARSASGEEFTPKYTITPLK